MISKKISLGTVLFGMNYGVSGSKKSNFDNSREIIDIVKKSGISFLDTAVNYGTSEEVLGTIGVKEMNITSKIPNLSSIEYSENLINNIFHDSLSRLNIKSVYGLLLHSFDDLFSENGNNIYNSLLKLKKQNLVKKIGVSVYNVDQIKKVIDNYQVDIIQCPFNIFDTSLIDSGISKVLKDKGIEIHVRSIFLQGLLLMPNIDIPNYFSRWKNKFLNYENYCKKNNISKLECCLNFVNKYRDIDKIVIGVENKKQLLEILNIKTVDVFDLNKLSSKDINLINPSVWKV